MLGGQTGYLIGAKVGAPLFARPDSRLFKQRYVDRSAEFFTKYGLPKAILLARFVPIVRTLINPFAGVIKADAKQFALWNAVGGVIWPITVTLLGYGLGSSIKSNSIDKFILPVIFVILVISVIPLAIEIRQVAQGVQGRRSVIPSTASRLAPHEVGYHREATRNALHP